MTCPDPGPKCYGDYTDRREYEAYGWGKLSDLAHAASQIGTLMQILPDRWPKARRDMFWDELESNLGDGVEQVTKAIEDAYEYFLRENEGERRKALEEEERRLAELEEEREAILKEARIVGFNVVVRKLSGTTDRLFPVIDTLGDCRRFDAWNPNHYTYELCTPDEIPFYVGKGSNGRVEQHEKDAARGYPMKRHKVIQATWETGKPIIKRIISCYDTAEEAFANERRLIREYTSLGYPLTN